MMFKNINAILMVNKNNDMDILLNSRYVGKCRPCAGNQMTTITFRRNSCTSSLFMY